MISRLMRFGLVGVLCLGLQIAILYMLRQVIHPVVANGIGFLLSAQLNFVLSYIFTWSDSERKTGWRLAATWVQFNTVVLVGVVVNALAFALARQVLSGPDALAVLVSVIISTIGTFLLNHLFVLPPERTSHGIDTRNGVVPASVE